MFPHLKDCVDNLIFVKAPIVRLFPRPFADGRHHYDQIRLGIARFVRYHLCRLRHQQQQWSNRQSIANGNAAPNHNPDSNAHGHSDSNTNSNGKTHSHSDGYANSHADTNTNSHANTNSYANTVLRGIKRLGR